MPPQHLVFPYSIMRAFRFGRGGKIVRLFYLLPPKPCNNICKGWPPLLQQSPWQWSTTSTAFSLCNWRVGTTCWIASLPVLFVYASPDYFLSPMVSLSIGQSNPPVWSLMSVSKERLGYSIQCSMCIVSALAWLWTRQLAFQGFVVGTVWRGRQYCSDRGLAILGLYSEYIVYKFYIKRCSSTCYTMSTAACRWLMRPSLLPPLAENQTLGCSRRPKD